MYVYAIPQGMSTLAFETAFLSGLGSPFFKQDCLVREPQGSSCLHLPNFGIVGECHQGGFSHGCRALNLGSHDFVEALYGLR